MFHKRAGLGDTDRGPLGVRRCHRLAMYGAFAVFLVVAGCSRAEDVPPAADQESADPDAGVESGASMATDRVLRGMYTFAHEVRVLRPCGSAEALWVRDGTDLLRSLHGELRPGAEPYEEIFVAVRGSVGAPTATGFAADYDGELTVSEVQYAAREGLGCDTDWGFRVRASGNEPFWTATVDGSGLRLSRPGEPDHTWTDAIVEAGGDTVRITVPSNTSPRIELRADTCRDSMSGAFSPWTARLRVGDRVLTGCAVTGASFPTG